MDPMKSKFFESGEETKTEDSMDAKNWEDTAQTIENLAKILLRRATERFGDKGIDWLQEKKDAFLAIVRTDNPDWEQYIAYHALTGSSAPRTIAPKLDFSGSSNVEQFCVGLMGKILKGE